MYALCLLLVYPLYMISTGGSLDVIVANCHDMISSCTECFLLSAVSSNPYGLCNTNQFTLITHLRHGWHPLPGCCQSVPPVGCAVGCSAW
jgi:hypothetical protein